METILIIHQEPNQEDTVMELMGVILRFKLTFDPNSDKITEAQHKNRVTEPNKDLH